MNHTEIELAIRNLRERVSELEQKVSGDVSEIVDTDANADVPNGIQTA